MSPRNSVFVVDDDAFMRKALERLLREHGFYPVLFDSAEALQAHKDFSQGFCIILDIDLNGVSGVALRRTLAKSGITLPIIYITGNDDDATRAAAMASGCTAYLNKPFSAKSLVESIKSVYRPPSL
ncbi:response regulator [Bradyrhizobium sp. URHC0002]|jgi:FixJ family two-component response regulator